MAHGVRRRSFWSGLALVLAGCGTGLLPDAIGMPSGSRQWIIEVDNASVQEARLFVALDTAPMGDVVGTAEPSVVPPRTKLEVVLTVPPGSDWAIFVNPSPERGPLLLAADAPLDVTGRLPISFGVDPQGNPWVAAPGGLEPGWFGE